MEEKKKKEEVKEAKVHMLDERNPDFKVSKRHVAIIEIEKGDNHYRFEMDFGSPLDEGYMATVEVLKEIK